MDAADVVDLLDFLEQSGLEVYVDGGWAVDALLGEQTQATTTLTSPYLMGRCRCSAG